MKRVLGGKLLFAMLALSSALVANVAQASVISWTNWTNKTYGSPGSATGTMNINGTTVGVSYTGEIISTGDQGDWNFSSYTSPGVVDNAPTPANTSIQLAGGNNIVNTLTFSTTVIDPIFAVQSLGNSWDRAEYVFDKSFTILNDGNGHWGSGSLIQNGNSLSNVNEGNGILMFAGAVNSISWTSPDGEYYHMFTVGASGLPAPTQIPEPTGAALLGLGLSIIGFSSMRKRAKI